MVNTAVLRRARVARDFVNTVWQRARASKHTNQGRRCPYCHAPMVLVAVSTGKTHLSLDACLGCSCIWFDPGEYQAAPLEDDAAGKKQPLFASQDRPKSQATRQVEAKPPPAHGRASTSLESLLDALAQTTKAAKQVSRTVSPAPVVQRSAPPREPSPKALDIKLSPERKPLRPKQQAARHTGGVSAVTARPAPVPATRPQPHARTQHAVPDVRRPARVEARPTRIDYDRDAYSTTPAHHGDAASAPEFLAGLFGMPVEDGGTQPVKTRPWLTWGTVAILVIVYLFGSDSMARTWGFVPQNWFGWGFVTAVTCFFVHAGWLHLISNSYFLVTFGDNVEDHLGMKRYFWLLVIAHLTGIAAHGYFDPRAAVPLIGASAGISGVIAFYAVYPPALIRGENCTN